MTIENYISALAEQRGVQVEDINKDRSKYAFQLNNRGRGKSIVKTLTDDIGISLQGKDVIDIGSGHGGLTIELHHAGANVVGVEKNENCIDLAKANACDEADINFVQCDASSKNLLQLLKPKQFDVAVVFDVFEHVYDTVALVENVRSLLRSGGIMYFMIPNGKATRYVKSEGHKGIFGVSLIDPDCWQYFTRGRASIFYRDWRQYKALFEMAGFNDFRFLFNFYKQETYSRRSEWDQHIQGEEREIRELFQQQDYSPTQRKVMEEALENFFASLKHDQELVDLNELGLRYSQPFWEGCCAIR